MSASPKEKPPRGRAEAALEDQRNQNDHSTFAPWRVVIDGKSRGLPFGRYASRAGAEAIARRLRGRGLAARVVEPAS